MQGADIGALAIDLGGEGETAILGEEESRRWAVRGVRPRLLCTPSTPQGLANALACCDRAGASAIPWGGGTQQRLGAPPRRADIAISTGALKSLIEHEPADLTATVEAGMPLSELQAALARHGQWLPIDPPLKPGATVGGLVATNASGPRRLKEGSLRDLVIGTRVANVNGTLTRAGGRVVKNVTGYDLNKLHIGALGTLGVLVEVTFKVAPRPETERTWVGTFRSLESLAGMVSSLLRLPLAPTALDLLNRRAAERLGLVASPGEWVLLARASGFQAAVERHLREFDAAARSAGASAIERPGAAGAEHLWSGYGEMAAELRWSAEALTCRLALPPASVGAVCGRIAALGEGPILWAHGTGAVFWSVEGGDDLATAERVAALREMAAEVGGALVVENQPSALAGVDVWGAPAGPVALMRAVKAEYDPRGTLNPGRFVGGI